METQKLIEDKLGLRVKQEIDGILIYGNTWTLIADIFKWIKLKIKIFIFFE